MTSAARALPVIDIEAPRRGPDRGVDRQLTFLGLAGAIAFLVAALLSLALPISARLGSWLPLHLVLAGAVGTAIAAMLPFFVAALSVAPPAPMWLRVGGMLLVAAGASAGVLGRMLVGAESVAAAGAFAYVIGMGAVGLAAAIPLRHAAGPRRPLTELAYAIAVLDVIAGVSLVGLFLAGDPGVVGHWAALRVSHAWLNLLGFVTLTIAGTLIHFAPTVIGSRIRRRRSGAASVILLAIAAPATAFGYAASGSAGSALAVLGSGAAVGGAATLVVHGLRARGDRAGWTTDFDWRRFTGGSLLLAPVWLFVAAIVAAAGVAEHGANPQGWRLDRLGAPLVLGFVVQVLLGSLAHLLPAVGPGTPASHAAQRRWLGRLGTVRLWAWNGGILVLVLGLMAGSDAGALAGLAVALASGAGTVALLVLALRAR